jgi:hypothetical protein
VATAVFAAAPVALRYHSEAEAFAFNGLVVAVILWLAAAGGPLRGWRRTAALAVVAGLGLADHLTCVLAAPIGLVGAVRGVREAGWRAAVAGVVGLAIGLSPYGYLFIAPQSIASWERPRDLGGLWAIFSRSEYGGVGGFSGAGAPVDVAGQLWLLAASLGRSWLWLLAPLGLGAIAVRSARPGDGEPRMGWLGLAASWLLAGPLLVLKFDTPINDFGVYVVERFHLLPALLLVPAVAVGLDAVWRRAVPRGEIRGAVGTAIAAVGAIGLVIVALPELAALRPRALEAGVHNMLRSMPERAVILGHGDTIDTATRYAQLALGERRDVSYVHWTALQAGWYRARIAASGVVVPAGPGGAVALARALFAQGRPLFVDPSHDPAGELGRVFALYPYGFLLRVMPEGSPARSLDDVVRENQALYARFDLAYPRPSIHQIHAAAMNQRYQRTWESLAQALFAAGDREGAAAAAANAQQLAPAED